VYNQTKTKETIVSDKIKVVCPHCGKTNAIPANKEIHKANCGSCGKSLLDTHPVSVDGDRFQKYMQNSDIPVVVDFWAPWCAPCRMMAPNFEEAAKRFPLKASFIKVNTEEHPYISQQFGIRGIPTIIIFKNGQEVHRVSGALDANSIVQLVSNFI